jgi:hypothetical protein
MGRVLKLVFGIVLAFGSGYLIVYNLGHPGESAGGIGADYIAYVLFACTGLIGILMIRANWRRAR